MVPFYIFLYFSDPTVYCLIITIPLLYYILFFSDPLLSLSVCGVPVIVPLLSTLLFIYFILYLQTLYVASALIKCVWSTCAGSHCTTALQQSQIPYTAMQHDEDGDTSKTFLL